jgi:hypothetical protein
VALQARNAEVPAHAARQAPKRAPYRLRQAVAPEFARHCETTFGEAYHRHRPRERHADRERRGQPSGSYLAELPAVAPCAKAKEILEFRAEFADGATQRYLVRNDVHQQPGDVMAVFASCAC